MVIDEIIVKEDGIDKSIDSADNKTIDVITFNGKNLLNPETFEQGTIIDGNGVLTSGNTRVRTKFILLNAGTYTISLQRTNKIFCRGIHVYNYNTEAWESYTPYNTYVVTFTLSKLSKVRFLFNTGANDVITPQDIIEENPMLELGKVATEYEPYKTDYHFAKENEVANGICVNAVNEPIIDMKLTGKYKFAKNMFDKDKFSKVSDFPYVGSTYYNYAYIGGLKPNTEYNVLIQRRNATDVTTAQTVVLLSGSTFSAGGGKYTVISHYTATSVGNTSYTTDSEGRLTIGIYNSGQYITTDEKLASIWQNTDVFIVESGVDPIPNPDNPIQMTGVGERTKNLVDLSGEIINSYSTTLIRENDVIIAKSTGANQFQNAKIQTNEIPAGTTVTLSGDWVATSTNTGRIMFAYYDTSSKETKSIAIVNNSGESVNAIIPDKTSETQVMCVILYSNLQGTAISGDTITYSKIQIEEGNTKTEYEPYGYKMPIKIRGKNIVNRADETQYGKGATSPYTRSYPNTRAGTYTFSSQIRVKDYTGSGHLLSYGFNVDNGKTQYGTFIGKVGYDEHSDDENYRYSFSFTAGGTVTFFYVYIHGGCTGGEVTLINQMLTIDDTDLTYETYIEPVTTNIYLNEPLRKVGDYADYIDYKNKKVIRNVKELRLTSSIGWTYSTSGGVPYNYCTITDIAKGVEDELFMCNTYQIMPKNSHHIDNRICYRLNFNGFLVADSDYTSSESFGKMLDESNVVVTYPINSTEETIDIPEISTFDGTTALETDTTIQPSKINVKYWKQI